MPSRRWRVDRQKLPPNFSIKRARLAQRLIASRVVEEDLIEHPLRLVAGVDVAFTDNCSIGAAVLIEYPSLMLVKAKTVATRTRMPYIPTLLAFREMAPTYLALRKLGGEYGLLLVDGNGRLHPYLAGFACQLGLAVRKPTIGVAKKLLVGEVGEWNGDWAPIYYQGKVVGAAVKTRKNAKPIYVSVGHMISLKTSIRLVKKLSKGYKLPEPIRQAHIAANRAKSLLGRGELECI